jgi:ATP-dependent exoDNAse (exonuclease V) beta subunit
MPVMAMLEDGTLVEGIVDLAWADDKSWTLIDYKTDDADRQQYRIQLQIYAFALHRATAKPVTAILLEV